MCSSHQPENGADSALSTNAPQQVSEAAEAPENVKRGNDPQTGLKGIPAGKERVWAPFRDKGSHLPFSKRWDMRESFYNHGYRLPGEHYHKTEKELHECPWQPGDPAP